MAREIGEGDRGRRVFIDTDICIGILKENESVIRLVSKIQGKPVISTITIFELLLRKTNIEAAKTLIASSETFDFDESAAEIASVIFKQSIKKGRMNEYRDLFIAATVIANDGELLTLNKKDFENIDGLKVVEL